jgi:hypothetical protein
MGMKEYKMRVVLTVKRLLDCPVAEGKRSCRARVRMHGRMPVAARFQSLMSYPPCPAGSMSS